MTSLVGFAARLVSVVLLGGAALGLSVALLVPAGRELAYGSTDYGPVLPELSTLAQRSIVYDANGDVTAVLFAEEDRAPVSLDAVPDHLIHAVLAIEDRNFYEHNGVDVKAVFRAVLRNVEEGGVREGGSTITQQLVKIGLIENSERTVSRKFREAILAMRLEGELTKDEILERYLNQVYFGNGAYGVRAASERYFDKQPSELHEHESALLAGLIASPEALNPIPYPERADRRRHEVLEAMVEAGYLDADVLGFFDAAPLPREDTTFGVNKPRPDDYYVEQVKRQLLRDERLGGSYQERYQKVFRGGLRIHTAFDPRLQSLAEDAVEQNLPEGTEFTAALVSIDNATGAVRALVGGESFAEEQFNLATQSIRQTGSSFKAITLATALDAGYSPNDTINGSSPCEFDLPFGQTWTIRSPGGGSMSLRRATTSSINCAYARLALALGPEKIVAMADRLGIETANMQAVPSITLGTQSTPVLDMAAAYSVFANEGIRRPPLFVTRVEGPDGTVLFDDTGHGERVLAANTARTETDILQGVIEYGTGTAADIGRPAAGKTGTTDDYVDALFVGYTPQMTTAVWMGHPRELVPMRNVGQYSSVFGGTYPALIWASFMEPAHAGLPVAEFTPPDAELWPDSGYIDEDGRDVYGSSSGSDYDDAGDGGSVTADPPDTTTTPETAPPTTSAPTTSAPTTSPPTTSAPTTSPPTTSPPTTSPPTTTATTQPSQGRGQQGQEG